MSQAISTYGRHRHAKCGRCGDEHSAEERCSPPPGLPCKECGWEIPFNSPSYNGRCQPCAAQKYL